MKIMKFIACLTLLSASLFAQVPLPPSSTEFMQTRTAFNSALSYLDQNKIRPMGAWAGGTTYLQNDLVQYTDGFAYISVAGGNIGHAPSPSSSFWAILSTNAVTATALANTPTLCSSGQAATGVLANGNATGCAPFQVAITTGTVDQFLNGALGLTNAVDCTAVGGANQYNATTHTWTCHILASADIPNNAANTSGNAGTATALAGTPSICSSGQAPRGVSANGAATGCAPFQAPITTGSQDSLLNGTLGLTAFVNCTTSGGVLNYNTTTHLVTCHTLVAGDIPPVGSLASPSLGAGQSPITETWTVGAGGVTANTLVATDGSVPLKIVPATSGAYGIAMSTVAATGAVEVARYGTANCITDTGGATAGDLVVVGTGTVIDCKDSGQTSSANISITQRIIGVFRSSATAGNPALVELTPAHFGTSITAGGGSGAQDSMVNASLTPTPVVNCASSGGELWYSTSSHAFTCHTLAAADMPGPLSAWAAWSDVGFSRTAAGALKLTNGSSGYGTMDAGNFTVSGSQVAVVEAATTAGCISTFFDTGTYVYCPSLSAKIDTSGDLTLPGTATICSGCTGTGGIDLTGGTSGLKVTLQANPSTTTFTAQLPAGASTTHAVNNSGVTTPVLYDPGNGQYATTDNLVVNCLAVGAALLSACNSFTANQLPIGNATNGIMAIILGLNGNFQSNSNGCYSWNSGANAASTGADTYVGRGSSAATINFGSTCGARDATIQSAAYNCGQVGGCIINAYGLTSGHVNVQPQNVAGTPALVWPTGSGTIAHVAALSGTPDCSDLTTAAAHCGTNASELSSGTVPAAELPNTTVMAPFMGNANGTCAAATTCYVRLNATGTTLNVSSYTMPVACTLRNLWVYINAGTSCAPSSCSAWTGILQFELFDDGNSETVLSTSLTSSGAGDTGIGGNNSTWASPGNTCNSGAVCFLPNATASHLSDTTSSHKVNAGDLIVLAMQNNMTNGTTGQTSATVGAWGFTCGAN